MAGEGVAEASMIQSEGLVGRVFACVGAIFFAIVFVMACAVLAFFVGGFFAILFASLYCSCCSTIPGCQDGIPIVILGVCVSIPLWFATYDSVPLLAVAQKIGTLFTRS